MKITVIPRLHDVANMKMKQRWNKSIQNTRGRRVLRVCFMFASSYKQGIKGNLLQQIAACRWNNSILFSKPYHNRLFSQCMLKQVKRKRRFFIYACKRSYVRIFSIHCLLTMLLASCIGYRLCVVSADTTCCATTCAWARHERFPSISRTSSTLTTLSAGRSISRRRRRWADATRAVAWTASRLQWTSDSSASSPLTSRSATRLPTSGQRQRKKTSFSKYLFCF